MTLIKPLKEIKEKFTLLTEYIETNNYWDTIKPQSKNNHIELRTIYLEPKDICGILSVTNRTLNSWKNTKELKFEENLAQEIMFSNIFKGNNFRLNHNTTYYSLRELYKFIFYHWFLKENLTKINNGILPFLSYTEFYNSDVFNGLSFRHL